MPPSSEHRSRGNPNVEPLAQDHVIAARVPDHTRFFFHDPNLARLPDGRLVIAAPQWGRARTPDAGRPASPRPGERRRRRGMGRGAWAALPGGAPLRPGWPAVDVRTGRVPPGLPAGGQRRRRPELERSRVRAARTGLEHLDRDAGARRGAAVGDGLRPAGRHVCRQGDGAFRPEPPTLRPRRVGHVSGAGASRDAGGTHRQRVPGGSGGGCRAGRQDSAVRLAGAQHRRSCRSRSRVRPLHDPGAGDGARGRRDGVRGRGPAG